MATSKRLIELAANKNLTVAPITYRSIGRTNKGYDLIYTDGNTKYIVCSICPVHYSNGDRWMADIKNDSGIRYAKNMSELVKKITHSITAEKTHYILE